MTAASYLFHGTVFFGLFLYLIEWIEHILIIRKLSPKATGTSFIDMFWFLTFQTVSRVIESQLLVGEFFLMQSRKSKLISVSLCDC